MGELTRHALSLVKEMLQSHGNIPDYNVRTHLLSMCATTPIQLPDDSLVNMQEETVRVVVGQIDSYNCTMQQLMS